MQSDSSPQDRKHLRVRHFGVSWVRSGRGLLGTRPRLRKGGQNAWQDEGWWPPDTECPALGPWEVLGKAGTS